MSRESVTITIKATSSLKKLKDIATSVRLLIDDGVGVQVEQVTVKRVNQSPSSKRS